MSEVIRVRLIQLFFYLSMFIFYDRPSSMSSIHIWLEIDMMFLEIRLRRLVLKYAAESSSRTPRIHAFPCSLLPKGGIWMGLKNDYFPH